MNPKILAVLAAIGLVAVAGGTFLIGWPSSEDSSDSTTTYVTYTDTDDDEEEDDTETWTATETDADTISGFSIVYSSGTEGCYSAVLQSNGEYVITFSGITEDTVYLISGTLNGSIVIDAGDEYDFKLGLDGVTITSSYNVPIRADSAKNFHLAAKSGTQNYVYDKRGEVADSGISASVYSACDMKVKGTGSLTVVSDNNNGIHSKDDLRVRNLTLSVTCVDNALKGNDSVHIKSGNITLYASSGDGIKTDSTDTSSSGVQRGNVVINSSQGDTVLSIYAYCDGIDAAYDAAIEETGGNSVTVTVKTYTGATTKTLNSSSSWGGHPGHSSSWGAGGNDSNTNKITTISTKGIKADNSIVITGGTVSIDSYDDSLHANSDVKMESTSKYGSGNITVSSGSLTLSSSDDAIHADGAVSVSGGTVTVKTSYEGIEGASVTVSGGYVSVTSSDDGINSSGSITLSGGYVYVYAGGDGIDSNSTESYKGIIFSGADVVIVSTSGGNSCIDTDRGYTYSGGRVLAICPTGMTQEALNTGSSAKTYKTGSFTAGSCVYASVSGTMQLAVKMPVSISSGFVLYLGSGSASFGSASSVSSMTEVFSGVYVS